MENENKKQIIDIKNSNIYFKLRNLSFVEKIFLYGSRARGDNFKESDIDFTIKCFDDATKENWREIIELIENAKSSIKIDCVRYENLTESTAFKVNIDNDKILLFERKKTNLKWYNNFLNAKECLDRFSEINCESSDERYYLKEATIQRFEVCFELFWKLFKRIGILDGVITNSPRQAIQLGYSMRLVKNDDVWLDMLESRNATSHEYSQDAFEDIYFKRKEYLLAFQLTLDSIKEKYNL